MSRFGNNGRTTATEATEEQTPRLFHIWGGDGFAAMQGKGTFIAETFEVQAARREACVKGYVAGTVQLYHTADGTAVFVVGSVEFAFASSWFEGRDLRDFGIERRPLNEKLQPQLDAFSAALASIGTAPAPTSGGITATPPRRGRSFGA